MICHRGLRYAGITLGCLIASCSINLFLVPSHLLTGGATGIAIIVYYLTGLPIGLQTFAYNIPLLAAAWRLMGRRSGVSVRYHQLMGVVERRYHRRSGLLSRCQHLVGTERLPAG